jgi:purine-binding chemotaxis protein CheW
VGGEEVKLGALVDSVQEVLELENENLLPPPSIGSKYKSEFIEGIANVDEKFIMVLNMDLIFSADDLSQLKETLEQPQAVKAKQDANKDAEKPKKKTKKA